MTVTKQTATASDAQLGMRNHRFIFVGGSARSGTTLVQKMLCAHSRICGGPEFDHAVPAMQLFARMSSPLQLERQAFYYTEQEVTDRFREFYASLFDGLAARNTGVAYVSEKTPANIAAAADLLRLFPDAFYVNVVRDGRDVVSSHRAVLERFRKQHGRRGRKWWHEYSVREVSRIWNLNVEQYYDIAERDDVSDRVLNIKYEELVVNPRQVFTLLFEHLKLGLEDALFQPERMDPEKAGFSAFVDGVWYTDQQFNQKLNTGSVGKWRRELSVFNRFFSNFLQCRNLQRLGYPVSPYIVCLKNTVDRIRGRNPA